MCYCCAPRKAEPQGALLYSPRSEENAQDPRVDVAYPVWTVPNILLRAGNMRNRKTRLGRWVMSHNYPIQRLALLDDAFDSNVDDSDLRSYTPGSTILTSPVLLWH